jgi:2-keto-4-pentenoate hydratase
MTEAQLIDALVDAQRAGSNAVDSAPYAALDREAAYRVQVGVMNALGETAGMLKTAVHADGVGVVAPIYADKVGRAPCRLSLPTGIGLEVEVGVVLGRDLPASATVGEDDVAAAVDHYFLGVEICGTRYPDRKAAGPMGGLADNMSGLGYVIGPRRAVGADIAGCEVVLEFAGKVIHAAAVRHAFGTVLASLVAYARAQRPEFPLRSRTIVTTGSMCGLVPASGPGRVKATFGAEALEFDLV